MATLFQTSSQLRRILVFVLIGLVGIMVFDNVSKFLAAHPEIGSGSTSFYVAADSVLGVIPKPPMTGFAVGKDSKLTFLQDTKFGKFPETALVYSIAQPREKINTVEDAVNVASSMGFTGNYTAVSTDEISWTNSLGTRTLIFNKVLQHWHLRTKYVFDPAAQTTKTLLSNEGQYEATGTAIASRLGFNDLSLQQGKVVAAFALLGSDGLFTHPLDQNLANYVSIDIYRNLPFTRLKSLAELPGFKKSDLPPDVNGTVYQLDPLYGPLFGELHMIVSNRAAKLADDLYEMDFTNYLYNYTNVGIRSIITPDEAWTLVSQGKGALAQLRLETADYFSLNQSLNVTKFTATSAETEVGYFEPDPWDGFVYPIYIFHGKAETDKGTANFTFFVDAIRRVSQ